MMPIPTITVCPVCKDPKPSEAAHLLAERDRFMDALKQADKRIKGLERDLLIHKERYDRMKIRIQSALGNCIDQEAWKPSERWVDAACRNITENRK